MEVSGIYIFPNMEREYNLLLKLYAFEGREGELVGPVLFSADSSCKRVCSAQDHLGCQLHPL